MAEVNPNVNLIHFQNGASLIWAAKQFKSCSNDSREDKPDVYLTVVDRINRGVYPIEGFDSNITKSRIGGIRFTSDPYTIHIMYLMGGTEDVKVHSEYSIFDVKGESYKGIKVYLLDPNGEKSKTYATIYYSEKNDK